MLELLAASALGFVAGHLENSDNGRKIKNFLLLKASQTAQGVMEATSKVLKKGSQKPPKNSRCASCGHIFFTEDLVKGLVCKECYQDIQEMNSTPEPA